jgi:hypothetical protein
MGRKLARHCKPVRKCVHCALNLGDHCWLYRYPRGQWRHDRRCHAHGDSEFEEAYRHWCKLPTVRSTRDIRRLTHRAQPAQLGGEGAEWSREYLADRKRHNG